MTLFRIHRIIFGMGLVALCFSALTLWELLHYQGHVRSPKVEVLSSKVEGTETNDNFANPSVPETVARSDIVRVESHFQTTAKSRSLGSVTLITRVATSLTESNISRTRSDAAIVESDALIASIDSPKGERSTTSGRKKQEHRVAESVAPTRVTHFPTRIFTPPRSEAQKLEAKFGIFLQDCRMSHVMAPRLCRGYDEMRFLGPHESNRSVALASFPGSGNTWFRLLLEQATGVFTGSVYSDKTLKCTGFLGEGSWSRKHSEMLAIKTHDYNKKWEAAIFLVRSPYKAILSYYHWKMTGSHTKTQSVLRNITPSLFESFLDRWKDLWDFYIFNQGASFPILIIQYENLIRNFRTELSKATVFLNQTVPLEKFECLEKEKHDHYRRKNHSSDKLFLDKQLQVIDTWIQEHRSNLTKMGIQWEYWKWNSDF